jgi:radical SAM protein with 4Fe4S-binding SPASM domain
MATTSSLEPEPALKALPDADRRNIHIVVRQHIPEVCAGRQMLLDVQLRNDSSQSISSDAPQQVFLSYHWANIDGSYEQYAGKRTKLSQPLPSGGQCNLEMRIAPPAKPGQYELQVGLLQEGISWFETRNPQHLQKVMVKVLAGGQASLRALKKLPRYAEDRSVQVDTPPAIFSFELTNLCPFKCIMCPRTNNMTRPEGHMSFQTFKKALDEFVELNPEYARNQEVWLHGFGESLVHPEFAKFMRYAVEKGVNAGLSINPLMLTKKVASDLLDAAPRHLYVALDGHDDKSFEKIRGVPNAYHKSKKRLLNFLQEKERRGVKTKITLCMIDFPNNRQSIDELESFWNGQEGINTFSAKPFVNWDGKAEDVNLLIHPDQRPKPSQEKVLCDFPWEKMTVSWDGHVVPCCFDYNKKYSLGDINKQSLQEIWNGEKMHALRREMMSNKVSNPLCAGCDYLYQDIVP